MHGEAGIGKTALLNYVLEAAENMQLLQASGVESDMELAFASLHQLCTPLLDGIERLPPPQRDALEIAFGLAAGPSPNRFLVGLAVLTLLSEKAEQRPLLCVVDDAQWLDEVSARTLAFVARRLLAERIGVLFAARVPTGDLQGLPELEVPGLRNGDALGLLDSSVVFRLDERVRNRIVAETRGNPLALLELPRGLTATQLAGGFGLSDAAHQTLSTRLEQSFQQRLDALPQQVRTLLLIAAAEPVGDPLLLWRAAERLGIDPTAADATDDLLTIEDSVRFRHPLVRSAAYRSATAEERRAVHSALAEVTDRDVDPDRRAWHLAEATTGPDEAVAGELAQSAGRAQSRGGVAASAAFLRRATALTPDPDRRSERALAAAQLSLRAGMFDATKDLLVTAEAGPLGELQRAKIDLVRAQLAWARFTSEAPALLLRAARALEPVDVELARETYVSALGASHIAGRYAQEGIQTEICSEIRNLPPRPGGPFGVDLLLEAYGLLDAAAYAAAASKFKEAAKALLELSVDEILAWGWNNGGVGSLIWDRETEEAILARNAQVLREAGALASLPVVLTALGQESAWRGDFAGSRAFIREVDSLAAATGAAFAQNALLRLRALQGREGEASAAIADAYAQAAVAEQGMGEAFAHWAAAVLSNSLGRYEEAMTAARDATSNTFEPHVSKWALVELVEAAERCGQEEEARGALERLLEVTRESDTNVARGFEARCRALLAGDAAEVLYIEAIDQFSQTRLRPELARAHLLYGEWLRSADRRGDAREQLRKAHELFVTIGMEAFAERARRELLATGDSVRRPVQATRDDLTPQEEQIARLARDGRSNQEIAALLFLSARTVEWHLRKVYAKLGITSRRSLPAALPDAG
jgi:DNA-binding CsgD family transcriptional regulator